MRHHAFVGHDCLVTNNSELLAQLERIAQRDEVVQAWVSRHPDAALIEAFATAPEGPLSGWTLGVKDVIDTSDLPTERGSPIYSGNQPVSDAACVSIARDAGAVVIGKTVTTEFALFTPNITTNPHDPSRTPGGSSSGSAAAVADGQVRTAFGTQTVGSVIRPAAFCGVVGFKPTYDLMPLAGVATLSHALDTLGWFTNNVEDASTMFSVLTGAKTNQQLSRGRVGRYQSHQWDASALETRSLLDSSCGSLAAQGVEIVDLQPLSHLEQVFEAANTVLHYEIVRVFAWERSNHLGLISDLVQKMLLNGDKVSHEEYQSAQAVLSTARHAHAEFMAANELDALLTPSAPGEAPPIATTGDSVFNRVWTALGVPSIHLPLKQGPSGLPIGIQLVGESLCDGRLLATAALAESAFASSP